MTEANYRYLTLWHNSVLLLFLGTGSVLNTKGEVEMDSVIMDGRELQCGSVACVQNIKNPVSLARAVLEKVRRQHSTPSLNISDLIYTYLSWELKKRSCLVFEKNKAPVSILLIPPSPQKKKRKEKRKRIWAVRLGVKLSTNSMKNNVFFLNSDRSHTPGWERRKWVCRGNRDPYGTDGQPGNGGRAGGMAPFHAIQNHSKRAL